MTVARRRQGPPRRNVSSRAVRREIQVFTEGKTEDQYLTYWHRRHREHILVRVDDFHGGPLQLVQEAVARSKADQRAERKSEGRAPSETWCMFDIDEHPNVRQACQLAADNGIQIAVSNPCLELWYLIHFRDQTAWIHRHAAQYACGEFITKSKVLTPVDLDKLVGQHDEARARAQGLDRIHNGNGSQQGENPSSDVWVLVDSIRRVVPAT